MDPHLDPLRIVLFQGLVVVEGPLPVEAYAQVMRAGELLAHGWADACEDAERRGADAPVVVIALGFAESLWRGAAEARGYRPREKPSVVLCLSTDLEAQRDLLRQGARELHPADPMMAWWAGPDTGASSSRLVRVLSGRPGPRVPHALPADKCDEERCRRAIAECWPWHDLGELRHRLCDQDPRWSPHADAIFGEVACG